MSVAGRCELCGREVRHLTKHHLVPRTRHRNRRTRRRFDRDALHRTIWLCRPCHSNLHVVLTEKELAEEAYDFEQLRAHPDVRRFTDWIRTKPPGTSVPMPRRRRR